MEIIFNNKTINSKHATPVKDINDINYIKTNYFTGNKTTALKQLSDVLLKGKMSINHIYSYYFEKVASKTILYHSKFSIWETLHCDELIQLFINKTKTNPKVFDSDDILRNFKTAIRLGGKGITAKASNFPLKECVELLKLYGNNDLKDKVYVDTSCGWGVRMLASAILDINYIGFDVNSELIEKLNEFGKDIQNIKPNWKFCILNNGSQYYTPALFNSADIMLTSPPYFNLEDYGNNEYEKDDSIHGDYQNWIELYVKPLMVNSAAYIKENGYILINVKDFNNLSLEDDFIKCGKNAGLKYHGFTTLKNIQRVNNSGIVDNSEKVLIFHK